MKKRYTFVNIRVCIYVCVYVSTYTRMCDTAITDESTRTDDTAITDESTITVVTRANTPVQSYGYMKTVTGLIGWSVKKLRSCGSYIYGRNNAEPKNAPAEPDAPRSILSFPLLVKRDCKRYVIRRSKDIKLTDTFMMHLTEKEAIEYEQLLFRLALNEDSDLENSS